MQKAMGSECDQISKTTFGIRDAIKYLYFLLMSNKKEMPCLSSASLRSVSKVKMYTEH